MRRKLVLFALIFALVFVLHLIVVYFWNLAFPPEGTFDWGMMWWRAFVLAFVAAITLGIVLPLAEQWRGNRQG